MATAEFSKFAGILSAALSQNHLSGFEITDYIDSLKVSSHRIIIKFKDKTTTLKWRKLTNRYMDRGVWQATVQRVAMNQM